MPVTLKSLEKRDFTAEREVLAEFSAAAHQREVGTGRISGQILNQRLLI